MNTHYRLDCCKLPPPPPSTPPPSELPSSGTARDTEATSIGHGKAPQDPSISPANPKPEAWGHKPSYYSSYFHNGNSSANTEALGIIVNSAANTVGLHCYEISFSSLRSERIGSISSSTLLYSA